MNSRGAGPVRGTPANGPARGPFDGSRALFLAVLLLPLVPDRGFAQDAETQARRQADRIEREKTERQRRQRLLERFKQSRPPRSTAPAPPPAPAAPPAQGCVRIGSISVGGVSAVPRRSIAAAVAPFEGRCLGLADLDRVLKAVTFVFVEAGYVAARAYLPAQDLSDGTLDIVVIEGILEDIAIDGASRSGTAFPGLVRRPLNLRHIEQGLDQINRLRSKSARIELRPGKQAGGTAVDVRIEAGKPWHIDANSDDLGAAASGRYRSRLSLGVDNSLGLYDRFSLSWLRAVPRSPWAFTGERPHSDSATADFSVPYGYWTFTLNAHWSRYRSEIAGALGPIGTSGTSGSIGVEIHGVVHRDRLSKTALSARVTRKENKSYILGSLIDVSSRALTVLDAELTHSRRLWGGVLAGAAAAHFGLSWFGAFDDDAAPAGSPRGQFEKLSAWLRFTRPFVVVGMPLTWSGFLSGQWSPDPLFGSEQMSFGGSATVRGVREAALFGNRAALLRSEWSADLSSPDHESGALRPYTTLDCGVVQGQARHGIAGGMLCGWAAGLRISGGRFGFDLSYADLFAGRRHAIAAGQRPGVLSFTLSASL